MMRFDQAGCSSVTQVKGTFLPRVGSFGVERQQKFVKFWVQLPK